MGDALAAEHAIARQALRQLATEHARRAYDQDPHSRGPYPFREVGTTAGAFIRPHDNGNRDPRMPEASRAFLDKKSRLSHAC